MRSINIILHFENKRYAESLARGLCYEYTGLKVFLVDNEDEINNYIGRGILLTDKNVYIDSKTLLFTDELKDEKPCISKSLRLKEIMKEISNLAFKFYGIIPFVNNNNSIIIGVFSKSGGSGVTSFAITLSRLIAAKTEARVLYLNLGVIDDFDVYIEFDNSDILSKMQYLFMKEENIPVCIGHYCKEDLWGVSYFKPERDKNCFFHSIEMTKLIQYILGEKCFDYIIIDAGKTYYIDKNLINGCFELKKEIVTFSYGNNHDESTYELFIDRDSFVDKEDRIEISMRGIYAMCIESILDKSNLLLD